MVLLGGILLVPHHWITTNDVTTGLSKEYPNLQPRVYTASPDLVFGIAHECIGTMRRWKLVTEDKKAHRLEAEVRTFLFGFTDDVTVTIRPESGGSRVIVRSHSRVGKGDIGENARTIRALQSEMDRRLR